MSDKFDPYYTILGVARSPRPLTFYQLLGVELFESNPAVIAEAVVRRREQLRRAESSPHRKFVAKLLQQVDAAQHCLTDEVRQNKYDSKLRARLATVGATPVAKRSTDAGQPSRGQSPRSQTPRSQTPRRQLSRGQSPRDTSVTAQPQSTQPKPPPQSQQQQLSDLKVDRPPTRGKRRAGWPIGGVLMGGACLVAMLFGWRMLDPAGFSTLLASLSSEIADTEDTADTADTEGTADAEGTEDASSKKSKTGSPSTTKSDSIARSPADAAPAVSNETAQVDSPDVTLPDVEPTLTEPTLTETEPSLTEPSLGELYQPIGLATGAFFDQHCIRCHGPDLEQGGLRIDQLTADLDDLESVDHYQNILDEITVASMPPEDEPQPDAALITEACAALTEHLDAAKRRHESGGGKPVRRLTKVEYTNTVFDLMGVHIDGESLQKEGGAGAFDTQADALYTTDTYFGNHLDVARDAVQRFVASRHSKPGRRKSQVLPAPKLAKKKKNAGRFMLSVKKVPPAGHLIASFDCWPETPKSDGPIFTSTYDGGQREVLGTRKRPHLIESIFYEPKDESWARTPGMGIGQIRHTEVISPQPYLFFEKYRDKFGERGTIPDSAAKQIIAQFGKLMSRGRKLDSKVVTGLNRLFLLGRKQGEPFWEAIVEPMALSMCTVEAMLHFENGAHRDASASVAPIDLANRLSYFLWRSAPDSELIQLAQSGKLSDPAIRAEQVERMMGDEKFDRFLRDFSSQWLELDRQDAVAVDDRLFRDFDVETKRSMKEETIQFMSHVIGEDLPLTNLIDSDFAFVNNAMAIHYGMSPIKGDAFRKVTLDAKDRRGGILTHAGILMQTGTGERSSIVERGVFIAKKMMNAEPPPPPPLVDDLPTAGADFVRMSGAELVRRHASQPQCASCHRKIDPMGVGLEEFDAIGLRRTEDVRIIPGYDQLPRRAKRNLKSRTFAVPLETKGRLVTGQTFRGTEELKRALMKNKKRLAESYVQGLLTMANGRKHGFADKNIINDIVTQAARSKYQARSIVKAVVASSAFTTN